mmetsp:Transcript_5788/g.14091  ORF Transcript_5788/g.14091 Transcript_5788/m.14091 type:complete len:162 (-) Transcript_5788:156-641(-)
MLVVRLQPRLIAAVIAPLGPRWGSPTPLRARARSWWVTAPAQECESLAALRWCAIKFLDCHAVMTLALLVSPQLLRWLLPRAAVCWLAFEACRLRPGVTDTVELAWDWSGGIAQNCALKLAPVWKVLKVLLWRGMRFPDTGPVPLPAVSTGPANHHYWSCR